MYLVVSLAPLPLTVVEVPTDSLDAPVVSVRLWGLFVMVKVVLTLPVNLPMPVTVTVALPALVLLL